MTPLLNFIERLGLEESKSVFLKSKNYKNSPVFPPEVQFKIDLIKPDAYYTFNNQPFILFFDLTGVPDLTRNAVIHKQVWSFDSAPLIFLISDSDVETYNAFHYEKEISRLRKINITKDEAEDLFSFWRLETGAAWKWLKENEYEKYRDGIHKKRVNQRLFENIKEVREFLGKNGCTTSDANIIILRLIFIRYLIDRGVAISKTYINGNTIEENRRSFGQLIQKPKELNLFFDYLNDRFNGVLFKQKNSIKINQNQANYLSNIFDVRKDKIENSLFDNFYFDIFDFSIIPVEVISGIYESVIDPDTKADDSAIYTPPFLVEYILSNTVDKQISLLGKKEKKAEYKFFDPSCGSGIFLVQAYRRMVDEEMKRNGNVALESKRLREIAENNLFGTDLNEQSLLVASFSIYIALLDYKDPKAINNFNFPDLLGKNLFAANFFDEEHEYNSVFKQIEFDFILGNPPWKSKKDDKIHTAYIEKHNLIIGRFEIAQTFLLRTSAFMSAKTKAALIVTSTIFFNVSDTTKSFKKRFLTQNCIDIFFDLSAVRRMIFEGKNSPAAIVFYRKSESEEYLAAVVKHFSIKSNIFLKYFKALVIEKFDQKEILQKYFIEFDWMFKVALYGGVLDYTLLKRLDNKKGFYLKDYVKQPDFSKGDGIYKGSPKRNFDFLLGKPVIEASEIKPYYTNISRQTKKLGTGDIYLESGRKENLFTGDIILIKHRTKDETDLVFSYTDKSIVFRHGVYGVTSKSKKRELKLLYGYLISHLFTYFQFITSSAWGIATRPEVKLEEHLSFPFLAPLEKVKDSIIDSVDKFLETFRVWYKEFNLGAPSIRHDFLEKINASINSIYSITPAEADLINYALDVSRYEFQESKQYKISKKVHTDEAFLARYINVYFEEFSEVYEGEYLVAEIYPLDSFIAVNFKMVSQKPASQYKFITGNTTEKSVLSALSSNLTIWNITNSKNLNDNLFIQKDIKGFEENSFYIIKPNEYKCWHRAMAWYDVAEIKEAIETAEFELINDTK